MSTLEEQLQTERAQFRFNLAEKERELALVLRELAEVRLELARRYRIEAFARAQAQAYVDVYPQRARAL